MVELADGRLYFNARNHRGTGPARVHAWSSDGGRTLDAPYEGIAGVTAPGMSGYSDLVALPGGRIGAFYEAGETSSFATLRFTSFGLR